MAYDELLAVRIRAALGPLPGLVEKKMFGGICFLVNGNMACGVIKTDLIVRVGPEKDAASLARPHVRPFDFSGRPMAGWVYVGAEGCASERDLKEWIGLGVDFARSLPGR
jgi:TfoX/Sxy family transcriptional regulator of competence genes